MSWRSVLGHLKRPSTILPVTREPSRTSRTSTSLRWTLTLCLSTSGRRKKSGWVNVSTTKRTVGCCLTVGWLKVGQQWLPTPGSLSLLLGKEDCQDIIQIKLNMKRQTSFYFFKVVVKPDFWFRYRVVQSADPDISTHHKVVVPLILITCFHFLAFLLVQTRFCGEWNLEFGSNTTALSCLHRHWKLLSILFRIWEGTEVKFTFGIA